MLYYEHMERTLNPCTHVPCNLLAIDLQLNVPRLAMTCHAIVNEWSVCDLYTKLFATMCHCSGTKCQKLTLCDLVSSHVSIS